MPHTFEFEGVTVEYHAPTIRMRFDRMRLAQKLIAAYGYEDAESTPNEEWDTFFQYATAMSQSRAKGAAWWVESSASVECVRAAYECFLDQPETLYNAFVYASSAVSVPKKTTVSESGTSP